MGDNEGTAGAGPVLAEEGPGLPASPAKSHQAAPSGQDIQRGASSSQAWCAWDIDTCACCGKDDWKPGFQPRTLIACSTCQVRVHHVECLQAKGLDIDESVLHPDHSLNCSKASFQGQRQRVWSR